MNVLSDWEVVRKCNSEKKTIESINTPKWVNLADLTAWIEERPFCNVRKILLKELKEGIEK